VQANAVSLAKERAIERALTTGNPIAVNGYCEPCGAPTAFPVDYRYAYEVRGVLTPNWREQLFCPRCGLNNRMRAVIHGFKEVLKPATSAAVLLGEEVTPIARWLHDRYDGVFGCEYLGAGGLLGHVDERGVRNEDFTRLTFGDARFDFVLTFDVFEHIPRYEAALGECVRVLKPGGWLMFSVPFRFDLKHHLVRARVRPDGTIEHLLEPEYHGDPLNDAGCLAYYQFGWALVDDLREAGFHDPRLCFYWAAEFGYLGENQAFIIAQRPAHRR
jgi:SAM-dependent methyltransferase